MCCFRGCTSTYVYHYCVNCMLCNRFKHDLLVLATTPVCRGELWHSRSKCSVCCVCECAQSHNTCHKHTIIQHILYIKHHIRQGMFAWFSNRNNNLYKIIVLWYTCVQMCSLTHLDLEHQFVVIPFNQGTPFCKLLLYIQQHISGGYLEWKSEVLLKTKVMI